MRILVRGPNWVGDHLMAFPLYEGLRRAYPDASLSLLVPAAPAGWVPPGFTLEPTLGEGRRSPRSQWRLARSLREKRFDLAICLPSSVSAGLPLFLAGIPERVGFSGGPASSLFLTSEVPWRGRAGGRHKSEAYLDLLRLLSPSAVKPPATVKLAPGARRGFVVAPGAALPLREWPYYPELCEALAESYPDEPITLVGAPSDAKWSSRLARLGLPQLRDRIGATTLSELSDLCRGARLVVTNDSGAAHVAAATGAPVLVLFGPGDPAYVAPRAEGVAVARSADVPCSPCESSRCRAPFGYQACLRRLGWPEVLGEARRLLARLA